MLYIYHEFKPDYTLNYTNACFIHYTWNLFDNIMNDEIYDIMKTKNENNLLQSSL
jgi:predicted component of viral defense system (DUF524 family)